MVCTYMQTTNLLLNISSNHPELSLHLYLSITLILLVSNGPRGSKDIFAIYQSVMVHLFIHSRLLCAFCSVIQQVSFTTTNEVLFVCWGYRSEQNGLGATQHQVLIQWERWTNRSSQIIVSAMKVKGDVRVKRCGR